MKLRKQQQSLPVLNQDINTSTVSFKRHSNLIGNGCKRGLFVGSSGCGKTNAILCLLLHPNGLRFENVYIYSKSLYQPKYEYLRNVLKPIKEIGFYEFENGTEVIPPHEARSNSVFIFDDVVCCNQNVIRDYFSSGRHNGIDCFYLCQTYTKIPKQLVRDNANFLAIFQQDNMNLKHIFDNHVGTDLTFQQFKDMCTICWKDKYGFLIIDKESNLNAGRYRKGFDCFIIK